MSGWAHADALVICVCVCVCVCLLLCYLHLSLSVGIINPKLNLIRFLKKRVTLIKHMLEIFKHSNKWQINKSNFCQMLYDSIYPFVSESKSTGNWKMSVSIMCKGWNVLPPLFCFLYCFTWIVLWVKLSPTYCMILWFGVKKKIRALSQQMVKQSYVSGLLIQLWFSTISSFFFNRNYSYLEIKYWWIFP